MFAILQKLIDAIVRRCLARCRTMSSVVQTLPRTFRWTWINIHDLAMTLCPGWPALDSYINLNNIQINFVIIAAPGGPHFSVKTRECQNTSSLVLWAFREERCWHRYRCTKLQVECYIIVTLRKIEIYFNSKL